jgi:hypothetical protein
MNHRSRGPRARTHTYNIHLTERKKKEKKREKKRERREKERKKRKKEREKKECVC